ncbi:MAG: hypothetical protein A3K68_00030 [Euryarchaeota archaeon RBG_16_68_13]|nr:MAG: hypothetical protein A3K68_00030 [Euryarchaeota archaeon RBG_16_68_13]
MRQEIGSILAMGGLLAGSQIAALAIAPLFAAEGLQAFGDPENAGNALVYILLIFAFTGVILLLIKFRRRNIAKTIVLASIFLTLAFVLLLPVFYGLVALSPEVFYTELGANVATVLAFALAASLSAVLVKFPEWYVVDTIGIVVAAGVTAIMGISFSLLPALILLVALAAYDAIAVYRTKHMVALADELTSQRLPVLLVVPKRADYSYRKQGSLREQISKGEDREAMFIGLGDFIIPGTMSVSAFTWLDPFGPAVGGLAPNAVVALSTILGSLIGFGILMRFVLRGNPQAGLPLLNGGAITAFALSYVLVYGDLSFGLV